MAAVSGAATMPPALRPAPCLRKGAGQERMLSAAGPVAGRSPAGASVVGAAPVRVELASWQRRRHSALTAVSALTASHTAGPELPAGRRRTNSARWQVHKAASASRALNFSLKASSSESETEAPDALTETDAYTETSTDSSPPLLSATSNSPETELPTPTEEPPSSPDSDSTTSPLESETEPIAEQSPASGPDSPPLPHILGADYTVLGFIASGPLLARAGISFSEVEDNLSQWVELGGVLAQQLGFDVAGGISDSEQRRIFHYYLPVFFWCMRQLAVHRERQGPGPCRPLVVGISAPQGCGKTTVTESLEYLFGYSGLNTAGISLDDFYLTYEEQMQLAASNPGNKLLELRGNAGSHDLQLAEATLDALLKATNPDVSVSLPRYEKSAYSGRGDRAPQESWPVARGPVAVVLLEGWMLGFEPLPEAEAGAVDPDLVAVNQRLGAYKPLHEAVDAWVVIQVSDVECVFQWRLEAEVRMRSKGKPGMTDEQVADFVSRYMPAYKAYLAKLYSEAPGSASADKTLRISVDRQRNPLA